MSNQPWKASLLSVAGVAAVAHGSAAGPFGDRQHVPDDADPTAFAAPAPAPAVAYSVRPQALAISALGRSGQPSGARTLWPVPAGRADGPEAVPSLSPVPQSAVHSDPLAGGVAMPTARPSAEPDAQFAPQFQAALPPAVSRLRTEAPSQPVAGQGLHTPDTAYVAQISVSEAREYFNRVGLAATAVDAKTLGEFDFSQVERFATPSYFEVTDDPDNRGAMVVKPASAPVSRNSAADPAPVSGTADKNNEKSPVENPPQTGGSAEFE